MTAAKVSMRDGRNRALWFAFGASIIVFFQTLLAVFFARFIDRRADVSAVLQEIGLVIFTVLTLYFLWIAKNPNKGYVLIKKTDGSNEYEFYNEDAPGRRFVMRFFAQVNSYFFIDESGNQIVV